jgi:hypothetical protein
MSRFPPLHEDRGEPGDGGGKCVLVGILNPENGQPGSVASAGARACVGFDPLIGIKGKQKTQKF